MAFLIGGANSAADTTFSVANSCRFNRADSAYMHKTPGGAGSTKIFTFSAWVKRGTIGSNQILLNAGEGDTTDDWLFYFHSGDTIKIFDFSNSGATTNIAVLTNQFFRDVSAWYHLVLAVDTSQGTAANRVKLYVNGTQVSSFATATYPDQNFVIDVNSTDTHWIGRRGDDNDYFDGYMAEVCMIDGTQYAASDFGEFDEDSPTIWKPKDVSGLTFGTNGFYLDFEDSANLGNDKNGGTDLTEVNLAATDQATDSPSNNFATLNPLSGLISSISYKEGNTHFTNSSADTHRMVNSTIAAASGKWYAEVKVTELGGTYPQIGIIDPDKFDHDGHLGISNGGYGYLSNGNKQFNGSAASFGDSYATDDIIGIAMDLTNNKLYFAKNGTWQNSGDPTSGATGTGSAYDIASGVFYTFGQSSYDSGTDPEYQWNFGNPSYANSSDAADANGYGAFEYAPPSGYLALCTKNLGSDGG